MAYLTSSTSGVWKWQAGRRIPLSSNSFWIALAISGYSAGEQAIKLWQA